MDGKQLRRLKPELDTFLNRYLPLFGRDENHQHGLVTKQLVQFYLFCYDFADVRVD